jgi:hypothetical protein
LPLALKNALKLVQEERQAMLDDGRGGSRREASSQLAPAAL